MLESLGGWQVPPQATQDAHFDAVSGSCCQMAPSLPSPPLMTKASVAYPN